MKYLKIIYDEEELKWWYKYAVPPLKANEIYFVSLSIRKKRLSTEEKTVIPHNEMFNKIQIRHDNWQSFIKHIRRLEQRIDAYFPYESESFIQNALVTYWNICPVDCYAAMKDQMNHLTEIMTTLTDSALKNSKGGIEQAYYKVRKSFDTAQSLFARNFGTKAWIDFDIDDVIEGENYERIRELFISFFGKGNTIFVKTGGGMHCLVRRSEYKINPDIVIDALKKILPGAKEIVRNSNEMIPLPGTLQYNQPVIVMNKEDITLPMRPETFGESEDVSFIMGEMADNHSILNPEIGV